VTKGRVRRDCVAIQTMGDTRRDGRSGSSPLGCGTFMSGVTGVLREWYVYMALEPRSRTLRGYRSKASSPDQPSRLGRARHFVELRHILEGEGNRNALRMVSPPSSGRSCEKTQIRTRNRSRPARMVLLENFGPAFAEAASRRQGRTSHPQTGAVELQ